jgi:integrase
MFTPKLYKEKYTSGQKALTEEEYNKVIDVCTNYEDRLLILVAVDLGLRREDIIRLQVQNIDLEHGWVSYHEKKKGDTIHKVPIGPKMKQEIAMYIHATKVTDYLFPAQQKSDTPYMSGRTAYNRFTALCIRAGVGVPRPFHALRATCIKLKQKQGWTIEQVAWLIHDTVSTVQAHYSTPTQDEMKKIMDNKEAI